jgi:hypothetical protein
MPARPLTNFVRSPGREPEPCRPEVSHSAATDTGGADIDPIHAAIDVALKAQKAADESPAFNDASHRHYAAYDDKVQMLGRITTITDGGQRRLLQVLFVLEAPPH